MSTEWHVGLVGYGEVGQILAEDLCARGIAVSAYDVKLDRSDAAAPLHTHAAAHGVVLASSHAALAAGVDLVVCAVTASQTLAAADALASGLKRGAFVLDFNSASPGAKAAAAAAVTRAGGRYVEGAVMTSVPPHRIRVPLLLGGPDAHALEAPLRALGFAPRIASERLGVASATKMCRSVVVKGLEAMLIESLTTARRHGVEDDVLASLRETFPGVDWERQASYFFARVIAHGRRRAEEMREAAQTVREAGLVPWSAEGTAERQAWLADLADAGVFDGDAAAVGVVDWRVEADRILAALPPIRHAATRDIHASYRSDQ